MNALIIHRDDLKLKDIVYYCTSDYDFTYNWTSWQYQDSCEYHDIDPEEIVFGCIKNGLFHYVEDSS